MDMEDEDGTCLLDVLCDPQALNDFLHGTTELQTEDLLISASSGEPSLFTDAPSPVSLLGDGGDSPGTPPPGCVDLSFLEDALLSSPESRDDCQHQVDMQTGSPIGSPTGSGCESKEGEEEAAAAPAPAGEEEAEVACCDILQQSLQEADITEQTVALEGGLTQDSVSLFLPPTVPFVAKTPSVAPALPRDTQAAVEPPQPSLLAVGPGCPSLKPAAPPQLMGLLPGNVFPAPSPETTFSLSPVQGSSMIIHKAMTGVMGRPLLTPTLRAAAAHGVILQRGPLPIQPKLPISIQPKLVQISPKPSGQPPPGLTLIPGTVSPNILLSQPPGQKPAAPPPAAPKPVSLQLVNQGGSFVLQPQGLFPGQNQFLLPGQSQVTISQPGAPPLLTANPHGRGGTTVSGHLMDGSQILAVPQRQVNFSPVFTTTGQLALSQTAVLSGPLQLQSAPSTVFQMPAQLAGSYTTGGQRATLVHGPTLGNHITVINSAGVLPSDLASISIVNAPSVVQGLPFAAQASLTEPPPLGLQPASVVLLPERGTPEERNASEESFLQLPQHFGQVTRHPVSTQPATPPSPSIMASQTEPAPAPFVEMPSADLVQVVEEVAQSLSQNQDFMQQLQQQALSSPITSDMLVGAVPLVPLDSLAPSVDNEQDSQQATAMLDPCVDSSPLPSEDTSLLRAFQSAAMLSDQDPLLGPESSPTRYQGAPEFRGSRSLFVTSQRTLASPQSSEPPFTPGAPSPLQVNIPVPQQQPDQSAASLCGGGGVDASPVQQHTLNTPTAALDVESQLMSLHGHPSPPDSQEEHRPAPGDGGPFTSDQQLAGVELRREEPVTPAMRRHRFQQLLCTDHMAVQNPNTSTAFSTLRDAARRLLPYHVCAGLLPTQEDFALVDQEFDTVSGFLLRRTKDMVNKYRQLLVRETQESPSAEMVMLERLFLQAERFSLGEDRRRARRDPEYFRMSLAASVSSSGASSSSPPAWTRLSDRPPGLKTYRSSSRGALRLTIKQEVVHGSLKRDHNGRLTNGGGGGAATPRPPPATNGSSHHADLDENGAEGASRAPLSRMKEPLPVPQAVGFEPPPRDTPKVKCLRLDVPPHAPLQEDNVLSEHLQSAINSILELQRLQGPSGGPLSRASAGPALDQPVTSVLGGHL
uniref:BRD4-interacting chromatin-remodeling complex-associated protein isoform X2 n=1 Tax=Doryrhamphus excisus TaxID=161450 RepID=UPI0025AE3DA9|nr:BRD4-interacting chromatin-remodeling complex-associated protein isoform X2 [Doryrhamphus excisus]